MLEDAIQRMVQAKLEEVKRVEAFARWVVDTLRDRCTGYDGKSLVTQLHLVPSSAFIGAWLGPHIYLPFQGTMHDGADVQYSVGLMMGRYDGTMWLNAGSQHQGVNIVWRSTTGEDPKGIALIQTATARAIEGWAPMDECAHGELSDSCELCFPDFDPPDECTRCGGTVEHHATASLKKLCGACIEETDSRTYLT